MGKDKSDGKAKAAEPKERKKKPELLEIGGYVRAV